MAASSGNLVFRPLRLDLEDCRSFNDLMSFDRNDQDRALKSPEKRLRTQLQAVEGGKVYYGEVVETNSQVIGMSCLFNIGMFPDGGQPLVGWIMIHPDHRRRGLARRLLQTGIVQARKLGFDRIYTSLDFEKTFGTQFIQSAGFDELDRQYILKLDLSECSEELFQYDLANDMQLLTIGELQSKESDWAEKLHALCDSFMRDIPSRTGVAEGFPKTAEELKARLLDEIEINLDSSYVLLVEGVWAATAWMSTPEPGQDSCYHFMTGVHSDYRRRGFVKLIKRAGFDWCRTHGIRYIHTNQHDTNKPMLDLNMGLGFKIASTHVMYCHVLDEKER